MLKEHFHSLFMFDDLDKKNQASPSDDLLGEKLSCLNTSANERMTKSEPQNITFGHWRWHISICLVIKLDFVLRVQKLRTLYYTQHSVVLMPSIYA